MYDPAAATNRWKLSNAINYVFPANTNLPAGAYALVVGFDPATNSAALANFRSKYGVTASIPIFGPYSGHLNNSGETIELYKPDPPQTAPHPDAGSVPYVLVESVTYTSVPPWPSSADGTGMSLQRRFPGGYGNQPLNWVACNPNAGVRNCLVDTDGDGLPDDWEVANGLNPNSAFGDDGANGDPDGDRFTNLQEYLAGTDPHNAQSCLKIDSITPGLGIMTLRYTAISNRTYTLQYRTDLSTGAWQKLSDAGPFTITSTVQANDTFSPTNSARFYRLTTPKLP